MRHGPPGAIAPSTGSRRQPVSALPPAEPPGDVGLGSPSPGPSAFVGGGLHRGRKTYTAYPQLWISLWRSGDREAEILVTEAQHLWTQCSALLRAQVSDATWRTWFEAVHPVAVEDGTLVLAVPSALAKERIEGRYSGLVRDVMSDATGDELPVRFDVRTEHRSHDDLSDLGIS